MNVVLHSEKEWSDLVWANKRYAVFGKPKSFPVIVADWTVEEWTNFSGGNRPIFTYPTKPAPEG